MYRDNSLQPRDGYRLAALGLIAQDGPMPYVRLANAVRLFAGYFWGPTLDVMSSSIELMRFEGLLEVGDGDDGVVSITVAGRERLGELLRASLRPGASEFNKLIVALKVRFLDLLDPEERRDQVETLIEARVAEKARLMELRGRAGDRPGPFVAWLDHEIAHLDADAAWFAERLAAL